LGDLLQGNGAVVMYKRDSANDNFTIIEEANTLTSNIVAVYFFGTNIHMYEDANIFYTDGIVFQSPTSYDKYNFIYTYNTSNGAPTITQAVSYSNMILSPSSFGVSAPFWTNASNTEIFFAEASVTDSNVGNVRVYKASCS
jgi:hypothetical protein